MRILRRVTGFAAVLVPFLPLAAGAADPSDLSGAQLYARFCASCHGVSGEGDGPVADFFKAAPPDLRLIAKRHGGVFPADRMRKIIDGREAILPHGARAMPVWGWEFFHEEGGFSRDKQAAREARTRTDEMITRLVEHLRLLQQP